MASVTRDFGTFADDSTVGTITWNNPGNAAASDDSRASTATNSATSHYLKCTNPQGTAVPAGATINGIEIIIERSRAFGTSVTDSAVRIVKGGAIGATDRSNGTAWPTTDTDRTYGSPTDLWGETWTVAQINASDFGMAISVVSVGGAQPRIDYVRAVIYYTVAFSGWGVPIN